MADIIDSNRDPVTVFPVYVPPVEPLAQPPVIDEPVPEYPPSPAPSGSPATTPVGVPLPNVDRINGINPPPLPVLEHVVQPPLPNQIPTQVPILSNDIFDFEPHPSARIGRIGDLLRILDVRHPGSGFLDATTLRGLRRLELNDLDDVRGYCSLDQPSLRLSDSCYL